MMIAEVFRKKTRFNDVVIKVEFYIVVDFKEFDTVTRFISTLTRRENTQKIMCAVYNGTHFPNYLDIGQINPICMTIFPFLFNFY